MKKAVFLDRDGTIIVEKHYLSDPNQVILIEGAAEAIKKLNDSGYLVIMASNQSGVARGMFGLDAVKIVNDRLVELLKAESAVLDGIYCCPHHPKGSNERYSYDCECRKPRIGMATDASRDFEIDLSESFMIGDKLSDVEFGQNFGAKQSIFVMTGDDKHLNHSDDYVIAEDISRAVDYILENY